MAKASFQGIIFGDVFVNDKKLFIELFSTHYKNQKAQIDAVVSQLETFLAPLKKDGIKSINEAMAQQFSMNWTQFQQIVLMNKNPLQIIVAYRGQSGKYGSISQIIDQSKIEGVQKSNSQSYGINSGHALVTSTMQALRGQKVEEFLQIHLNGFLDQLEQEIRDDAITLQTVHQNLLKNYYYNNLADLKWRELFYGVNDSTKKTSKDYAASIYFSGRGLGQAYDAFMNHVANHNQNVYNYLSSSGMQANISNSDLDYKKSVWDEEGQASGHFPILLSESKNNYGWYTGGDIIIIDPVDMSVVYNIQLKTTTERTQSLFGIKIAAIENFIAGFSALTPQQKAEKIYDFFLTQVSNTSALEKLAQEDVTIAIKNSLGVGL